MIRNTFAAIAILYCAFLQSHAQDAWRLRMIDGTGFGDPDTTGICRMMEHDGYLYLASWNTQIGGTVYLSKDGETWKSIAQPGLGGGAANFAIVGIAAFRGYLYAGTWNQRAGADMYRAKFPANDSESFNWEPVTIGGFGNARNWGFTHMREFKGHLYAGCFNFVEGSEVWRSATGDPGAWEMCSPKGWGMTFNTDSTMMVEHGEYLYIGTECARDTALQEGTQLWRTDGDLRAPYDQWEQVNANGFGNAHNHNICGLAVLDDRVYAGTWNQTQGLEVWRATPSAQLPYPDWEAVAVKGFDDPNNIYTACLATLDDTLFVATLGKFETIPPLFFLPNAKTTSAHGGRLMKTTDGKTWENVDAEAFADPPYIGIQWIAPFRGKLYIGMHAFDHPAQLWVYEPSATSTN